MTTIDITAVPMYDGGGAITATQNLGTGMMQAAQKANGLSLPAKIALVTAATLGTVFVGSKVLGAVNQAKSDHSPETTEQVSHPMRPDGRTWVEATQGNSATRSRGGRE
jgi:hypothetical protein